MKQDSWLYSDSFVKRALAVWGYGVVGNLILAIPMLLVFMILSAIFVSALGGMGLPVGPQMMQ